MFKHAMRCSVDQSDVGIEYTLRRRLPAGLMVISLVLQVTSFYLQVNVSLKFTLPSCDCCDRECACFRTLIKTAMNVDCV